MYYSFDLPSSILYVVVGILGHISCISYLISMSMSISVSLPVSTHVIHTHTYRMKNMYARAEFEYTDKGSVFGVYVGVSENRGP